mmetsp:Transcript_5819/g.14810  ORF Transcript_5819/g.14810 Transcript_5819/m.14810 type:complete len:122 (-) Transcript_5819:131-496(-)
MKLANTLAFAFLVVLGTALPALSVEADLADIDFGADADLDWTAGSVLGLQRGYELHIGGKKKAASAKPAGDALGDVSLLGLQRGVTLKKVASVSEEAPHPASAAPTRRVIHVARTDTKHSS